MCGLVIGVVKMIEGIAYDVTELSGPTSVSHHHGVAATVDVVVGGGTQKLASLESGSGDSAASEEKGGEEEVHGELSGGSGGGWLEWAVESAEWGEDFDIAAELRPIIYKPESWRIMGRRVLHA